MQRFRTIVAIFMAWLWLPATQHCDLEAAGVLAAHCEHAGLFGCGESCAGDGCNVLEGGSYKLGNGTLKVPAPQLAACLCFICLNAAPVLVGAVESFSRSYHEHPLDWVPCWQFARRAALLPGAPSFVLA